MDSEMLRAGFVPSDTPTASFLGATEIQGPPGRDGRLTDAFCSEWKPVVSQCTADMLATAQLRGSGSCVLAWDPGLLPGTREHG